jgi:glycosyltransferase involved in cell wall biosynthesis
MIAANRALLERFATAAEQFADAGMIDDAIASVQVGAWVADARHPGVHASHRMERLLERIAAEHLEPLPARTAPEAVERVLHVATETYQIGGHSRMIWRWIERDEERTHTVVTTAQRATPAAGVGEAAEASGGEFVQLDPATGPLERARALRALAAEADVIVIYAHPYDPIPVLAFAAAGGRPPIVFFNHGDHLLWLGASIADTLYSLRPFGVKVGLRRGIPAERNLQGPWPVAGGDGNGPSLQRDSGLRDRARAALLDEHGWPADSIVVLSVGTSYKFDGEPGTTLLDLAGPVVEADPRVRLLAVGPSDDGAWREARERTDGRVFAMGHRTGLGALFASSDIYLESRPFGGPGATSEAAAHGLPVLTHGTDQAVADMRTTDPGYGATLELSADGYRATLQSWIDSPELRARAGAEARAKVDAADGAWLAAIEHAYGHAAACGPTSAAELTPLPSAPDVHDELVIADNELRQPVSQATAEALAARIELATRSEVVRSLFATLVDVGSTPRGMFAAVFCAPSPEPEELRTAIDEFRLLATAGLSARFVLAMTPEEAEPAIPVLEEVLADGVEIPVDFVIDLVPARARPEGAMELVIGDRAEPLAPHQYVRQVA